MTGMDIETIAKAAGAVLPAGISGDAHERHEICTDSRAITPGCVFVALAGDSFDGHRYIDAALAGGAAFAVAARDTGFEYAQADKILYVDDTRAALLGIAGMYRQTHGVKVVAVTGSVGKTTTKEMTACVLESTYKTHKTLENLNNEIGLSQTILAMTPETEAAVLELGVDGPGQMAPLGRCAAADVAIVSNIGVSHLEAFGERKNILREKLDVRAGMKDGATLILCADNDLLRNVRDERLNLVFYGISSRDVNVRAECLREFSTHTAFELVYDGKRFDAVIPCMGAHNVQNALAAFAAGVALGVREESAVAALKNYAPAGMRQKVVSHNGYTIIEDCYNASPDSMEAAMKTLGSLECEGRRIAVLSDMLELGAVEAQAHLDAGRAAAMAGIDLLLCTGERARGFVEGAQAAGLSDAVHFADKDALYQFLRANVRRGDALWFKASRGMKLESVIERIYGEGDTL